MGLRMALGAERRSIVRLVMREALLLVLAGLALGAPAALIVGRVSANRMSGLIFGLNTTVALLTLVAVVAAYLPAARASRVDPMIALRSD